VLLAKDLNPQLTPDMFRMTHSQKGFGLTEEAAMIQAELRNPAHSPMTEWDEEAAIVGTTVEGTALAGDVDSGRSSRLAGTWWNRLAGAFQSDEELWRWTGPWDL